MLLSKELLVAILDTYPDWAASPERFLKSITLLNELSTFDLERTHQLAITYDQGKELATVFINVLAVNIDPYENFEQLRSDFLMEIDLDVELAKINKKYRADEALNDMLEQAGTMPSEQTMEKEILAECYIQSVIERLRPYIQFY